MVSGLAQDDIQSADIPLAIRDRYLGPVLLTPVAENMAQRLARGSTGPLLEVRADTGILTQAIAAAVSADVSVVATDPSEAAVELGARKPGMSRVTWQRADADALPFGGGTFGTVACLLEHFQLDSKCSSSSFASRFTRPVNASVSSQARSALSVVQRPDHVALFREARRVLRPDGRFLFAVPSHIRHNPVSACVQEALSACFPSDPPLFLTHVLHGYADSEVIDNDLTAAGFTDAVYTAAELPLVAESGREIGLGLCLGTDLRLEIQGRAQGDAGPVVDAVAAALRRRFGGGPIRASMRVIIVSASG